MHGARRLFFAFSLETPWPETFPEGKLLAAEDRHLTLAFLGYRKEEEIPGLLAGVPPFTAPIAPTGRFSDCLFLPEQKPRVAAWEAEWLSGECEVREWHKLLSPNEKEEFLYHATICRAPKSLASWMEAFIPLPFYASAIHLYESLGESRYKSMWSQELLAPFTELPHTADIAYLVRGRNWGELYLHGVLALSFLFPPILDELERDLSCNDFLEMIAAINRALSRADAKWAAPFKAVSYAGSVVQKEGYTEWEMIVDV